MNIGYLRIVGVDKKQRIVKMRKIAASINKNIIYKPNCFCCKPLGEGTWGVLSLFFVAGISFAHMFIFRL